jgi:3-deoxy-D-manno-octulosonic-acid transferase
MPKPAEAARPGLMAWLALGLYALVLTLATPLYLWRVWSRGQQEPLYRAVWWQRLGWYDAAYRQQWQARHQGADGQVAGDGPVVWVHAVSLGEARAAAPLVHALRQHIPGMRLLLTHGTATGRDAGQALLQTARGDMQTWLPYDTPGATRRFLRQHRPAVGVLMETEVWPVLQREARVAGVPMVLANARLSDKSLRQGQRLAWLMRPAVQRMALVLAQTPEDAQRVLQMKHAKRVVLDDTVQVCGNVKFDMTPSPGLLDRGTRWQQASTHRPIVLAASTREGEEAQLLAAWVAHAQHCKQEGQYVQLVPRLLIVPRHPQRFDEVAALIQAQGLSCSRRSQWPDKGPDALALAADIWLGNTMGEMPAYYASARVALLGGSFAPFGGQNLIEAAACGCPVLMGPSTFNFLHAAEMSEAAGSAWRVPDWSTGVDLAWQMACSQQDLHDERQKRCLDFALSHRGAAEKMARKVAHQILG